MAKNDSFSNISPLDYRYGIGGGLGARIEEFLSENARIKYQARVEAAFVRVLAKNKICKPAIAKAVETAAEKVRADEVYEEERKVTKHDVRALVNVLKRKTPKAAHPYIHFGATSYDIVDTANALRYKHAMENLVMPELIALEKTLINLALKHRGTVQIGRTHGQYAEPITFGFAMAGYVDRLGSRIRGIYWTKEQLAGKCSGAVGAYNALSLIVPNPVKFEKQLMDELGLEQGMHSTQIVSPEPVADLMHKAVSAFTVLANLADDMRNLQRSEISEVAEELSGKQVGSSTMPHKRNPISFENVKSLWKEFMPRMQTVYMDSISEHQRDLTNSASARFLPELIAGLAIAANRMNSAMSRLDVDKDAMMFNLGNAAGETSAEPLYILLAKHGHTDAHEHVRRLSMKAAKSGRTVVDEAVLDEKTAEMLRKFTAKEAEFLVNPAAYIGASVQKTEQICNYWKKEITGMR
ncbi:adenylosuccinate lyase [Candidatus Micrarchaeota archaeon]|nr:adenylosuccinate lyase [Candidatus Micrarchaeota archaeon]